MAQMALSPRVAAVARSSISFQIVGTVASNPPRYFVPDWRKRKPSPKGRIVDLSSRVLISGKATGSTRSMT